MAIPVLATGWVVGAIFHATADDADLDRLAQAAVNVGAVTFTPLTGYHLASTTQAITDGTIVAMLDYRSGRLLWDVRDVVENGK